MPTSGWNVFTVNSVHRSAHLEGLGSNPDLSQQVMVAHTESCLVLVAMRISFTVRTCFVRDSTYGHTERGG